MMTDVAEIRAVALVSNGISSEMLRQALLYDGYDLRKVALIKQRPISIPWAGACGIVVEFDAPPSLRKIDQIRLLPYYVRTSRLVRKLLREAKLQDVYLANVDNIISNHILNAVSANFVAQRLRISIVAEGFMNYQDITKADRAAWRWAIKPAAAALLGLTYRHPTGHLSGSYEPSVERVFAYSPTGLKSPLEKFVAAEFPRVLSSVAPDAKSALIVLTGIGQWMTPEKFEAFQTAFVAWVNSQGFDRVFVKRHPFYPSGGIENRLTNALVIDDPRRLEEMATELPAKTVIGYCTTALVILKLMRPDLACIDWGSDFYCEHAYHSDRSVVSILRSADIQIIEMAQATNTC